MRHHSDGTTRRGLVVYQLVLILVVVIILIIVIVHVARVANSGARLRTEGQAAASVHGVPATRVQTQVLPELVRSRHLSRADAALARVLNRLPFWT